MYIVGLILETVVYWKHVLLPKFISFGFGFFEQDLEFLRTLTILDGWLTRLRKAISRRDTYREFRSEAPERWTKRSNDEWSKDATFS